ncbi:tyrosine-type recombinase/integrase [Stenotrophomonas sp. 22385]|uniref:tyrosine-type recombinase/integrase n=1 Tax=Stenotrophomonas sp. 22385 TaxID=3453915 RepID=UPI003F87366B
MHLCAQRNEVPTLLLIKQRSGIRPYLLQWGVPAVLANLWIGSLSEKDNTRDAFARDVRILYHYFSSVETDLESRLVSLKGITKNEVVGAAQLLCVRDGKSLARATCTRRLEAIRSYLRSVQDHVLSTQDLSKDELHGVSVYFSAVERKFASAFKKHINRGACSVHSRVLSEEEIELIHLIMHPESELNPFVSYPIRARNYCILRVACEAALRRSELVLLETMDVNLSGSPTISVKRPTPRVIGQRRDRSALKTQTKTLPLSSELANLLATYLDGCRPELIGKGTVSTALFPSTADGKRLSGSSINRLFSKVTSVIGAEAALRLHPHGLRATSTTMQRKRLQTITELSDSDLLLALSYHGGWAPGSQSVQLYTRLAIQEKVEQLLGFRSKPAEGAK